MMPTGLWKRSALAAVCCICMALVSGQAELSAADGGERRDTVRLVHGVSLDSRPGYIFPTSSFFRGENSLGRPMRVTYASHLRYAFRFGPDTEPGRDYPHVSQGVGLAYNTFFNRTDIGDPLAVYVFQRAELLPVGTDLSLDFEWDFGLSAGWKPFDAGAPQFSGFNDVVGSRINAYIGLGLLLGYDLPQGWSVTAGVDISHYSNGNTSYPNKGVNTIGARIGVSKAFNSEDGERDGSGRCAAAPFRRHFSYDLVVYGAWRFKGVKLAIDPFLLPGKFAVAGLNFAPMYNVSRYFRAGLSLDLRYDESANIDKYALDPYSQFTKFYRPPFIEQFSAGVSARVELVLPIFSVDFGIGRNFVCRGDDTDGFYQIAALKASLTRHLFIHVGYQLYRFHEPNNLMLGLGWRFGSGKR